MLDPMQRYEVFGILGFGQSSDVFSAKDIALGRVVAVKVYKRSVLRVRPEFRGIAGREARCLASLNHPNIVPIFDYLETAGGPVVILAHGGQTVKGILADRQPLPPEAVLILARQVAAALDYCALRGLAHRDVKPSNIVFDEADRVYLTDFGTAARFDDPDSWSRLYGTIPFLAPEQLLLPHINDAPWRAGRTRCDQFSFGVLLYQMLTGALPWQPNGRGIEQAWTGCTALQMLMGHPLDPCSARNPDLPAAVDPVIGRLLDRNPDARFESAGEAVEALAAALADDSAADRPCIACLGAPEDADLTTALAEALAPRGIDLVRVGLGDSLDQTERAMDTAGLMLVIGSSPMLAGLDGCPEWQYWTRVLDRPVLTLVREGIRIPYRLFVRPHLMAGQRSIAELAEAIAAAVGGPVAAGVPALPGPRGDRRTGAAPSTGALPAPAGLFGTDSLPSASIPLGELLAAADQPDPLSGHGPAAALLGFAASRGSDFSTLLRSLHGMPPAVTGTRVAVPGSPSPEAAVRARWAHAA